MDSASMCNGAADECNSSSESGWTMYIASPVIDGSTVEGDQDGGGGESWRSRESRSCESRNRGEGDEEGGDSMASDASSGAPCDVRKSNAGGGVKEKKQFAGGEMGNSRPSQAHGSNKARRANSSSER